MDEDISRLKLLPWVFLPTWAVTAQCCLMTLSMRCVTLVPQSFMWLLPLLEASHLKKSLRFIFPSYCPELNCLKALALRDNWTCWYVCVCVCVCVSVFLCVAACHKTVCSDVGDVHLQWHWSQVSVIDTVEYLHSLVLLYLFRYKLLKRECVMLF